MPNYTYPLVVSYLWSQLCSVQLSFLFWSVFCLISYISVQQVKLKKMTVVRTLILGKMIVDRAHNVKLQSHRPRDNNCLLRKRCIALLAGKWLLGEIRC